MADVTRQLPNNRHVFSLRQLMTVMTVCAVVAAVSAHTQSFGIPLICLAGFLVTLGFACYEVANLIESKRVSVLRWAAGGVMLIGSISIALAMTALIGGILVLVSQVKYA